MKRLLFAALLALSACDEVARVGGETPTRAVPLAPAGLPAFFDCLRDRHQTAVSAHRGGARDGMPENAIKTFELAVREAPVFLEIDVRAARDGLVVMHDETVDRTTSGFGDVADMSVAQIQALTLKGSEEHPPSLREALDWAAGKTVLELDIKQDVRFEDIVAEVRDAGATDRVIFVTYSVGAAGRLARLAPEAMLYVTIRSARDLDELERRGVDLSHIVAWTGDEEPDEGLNQALAARGVEARLGIFNSGVAPAEAAATGLQSISTDASAAAVDALDRADGKDGYGALQCATR
ncbi:glycerophosphodiester phosphodiesterase family protein [Terricaulis sp.]|uniref:glycerophosphodiester phosphodiesterase family protein n=1 Tax=Terricaulis sp. TaxID=2768686 RepID=UPI0037851932